MLNFTRFHNYFLQMHSEGSTEQAYIYTLEEQQLLFNVQHPNTVHTVLYVVGNHTNSQVCML